MVSPQNAKHIAQLLPEAQLHLEKDADHRFTDHIALREDLTIKWLTRYWGKAAKRS